MMKIKPFANTGGFTTFDNAILDLVMPLCKPNTWKVLCATLRKTKGWDKESDQLSFSQYMVLTGIRSRTTMSRAIQDALNQGFIIRVEAGQDFIYSLNKEYIIDTSTENGLVQEVDRKRYRNRTGTSPESGHTKESKTKKKEDNGLYPLAVVLAEVCKMDFEVNKGRLFKEAKTLSKASPVPTPELIKQHYNGDGWWGKEDWRGKKGDLPNLHGIKETWGRWEDYETEKVEIHQDGSINV